MVAENPTNHNIIFQQWNHIIICWTGPRNDPIVLSALAQLSILHPMTKSWEWLSEFAHH